PGPQQELERPGVGPVGVRRMTRLDVALLAEPGLRDPQHLLVVGAVRIVTVRAALLDRRMRPEERSALLRVAGVARVVERVLLEEGWRYRPVRVVAGGGCHLALAERHVGGAHLGRALLGMTGAARLELGLLLELGFRRDVLHDRVAARACEVAHLVRAALPEDPLALRVTGEAHRV